MSPGKVICTLWRQFAGPGPLHRRRRIDLSGAFGQVSRVEKFTNGDVDEIRISEIMIAVGKCHFAGF